MEPNRPCNIIMGAFSEAVVEDPCDFGGSCRSYERSRRASGREVLNGLILA